MVGHIWKKNPGSEDTTGSHVATLPVARKFHYRTTLFIPLDRTLVSEKTYARNDVYKYNYKRST